MFPNLTKFSKGTKTVIVCTDFDQSPDDWYCKMKFYAILRNFIQRIAISKQNNII